MNYIYKFCLDLFISIVTYLLGGFDEYIVILIILLAVNVILNIFEGKSVLKEEIKHKFKVLLVIAMSVLAEKIINNTIKLRFYCICVYSYSELCNIFLLLEDDKFKIPKKLKALIKKGEDDENKNEQKK